MVSAVFSSSVEGPTCQVPPETPEKKIRHKVTNHTTFDM